MNIVAQLAAWFTASSQWTGPNTIPSRLEEHLFYCAIAVAIATAIALPAGIGLGHLGRGGLLAINVSNAGRAIPQLGLLVLVFFLTGFGLMPALVALVVLGVPPMVTNSYTAMRAVDAQVKEAAIGMGMTRRQRLWGAEVPVALPLIMAGVRTSVLQIIATATVAAYVGLGGLGRYLIDGLSQRDYPQVLGGAIIVALLALFVEFLLSRLQALIVSRGVTQRDSAAAAPGEAPAGEAQPQPQEAA